MKLALGVSELTEQHGYWDKVKDGRDCAMHRYELLVIGRPGWWIKEVRSGRAKGDGLRTDLRFRVSKHWH
jgi:hypothetical protein